MDPARVLEEPNGAGTMTHDDGPREEHRAEPGADCCESRDARVTVTWADGREGKRGFLGQKIGRNFTGVDGKGTFRMVVSRVNGSVHVSCREGSVEREPPGSVLGRGKQQSNDQV